MTTQQEIPLMTNDKLDQRYSNADTVSESELDLDYTNLDLDIDNLVAGIGRLFVEPDHTGVVRFQAICRGAMQRARILIPSSQYQTKQWRKSQHWYYTGKRNECELYQINLINRIIDIPLGDTNQRINMGDLSIESMPKPMRFDNGFEYTEDFDGLVQYPHLKLYFNLKFICDQGGAQTRSLREVNHFIKSQLGYLLKAGAIDTYFINILDGDTCNSAMSKYMYLLSKEQYIYVRKYVFVGDMATFQAYWLRTLKPVC